MKSVMTLKEILITTATIGLLSAILVPVLKETVPADDFTDDITHLYYLGTGILSYAVDSDDRFPLGHGRRSNGTDGWAMSKYFPRDWPLTPDIERSNVSSVFIFNSILPYIPGSPPSPDTRYAAPGSPSFEYQPTLQVAPGKTKLASTYAYNGLLHGYPYAGVNRPSKLPLLTGANGFMNNLGWGLANPGLACDLPNQPCTYVPTATGCSGGTNGGRSSIFATSNGSSYFHYYGGQNWLYPDGHVDFRRLARTSKTRGAQTDFNTDPWIGYDKAGKASSYWTDGCHPWLFRPNFAFD